MAEKGKRENHADEADAIHDDYVDDVVALKKDISGRYRKEIADARNAAVSSAKQLAEKIDLERLKAELADPWCGARFPPWLQGPANIFHPDRGKPDEVPVGSGVRG